MIFAYTEREKPLSIPRLDLDQAIAEVRRVTTPVVQIETVATAAGLNRVLASDIDAPISLPPFSSSAMDGYAYNAALCDLTQPLKCIGTALAGHPYDGAAGAQECVRVTTGALIPSAADTVIIQENVARHGSLVHIEQAPSLGANIRPIGHDVRKDERVLNSGVRLNAFMISWLAACGIAEIAVRRRPRIAVFSSGDELVPPGQALGPGQIYDSNRLLLQSLLQPLPVTLLPGGHLADDPKAIRATLAQVQDADLIITSGGVSVGDADYLTDIVRTSGSLEFWRLNMKPGKPLAFGRLGECGFLGLPGNPVSTAVTFLLLGQPAILALAGAIDEPVQTLTARVSTHIAHRPGREEYQRGYLSYSDQQLCVTPTGDQSSNRLASFREANCLIRLDKAWNDVEPGQLLEVLPFYGLL